MMRMENHAVDDPEEIDHMLNVFSGSFLRCVRCVCVCEAKRSWVLIQNERPYYIAFLLPFFCIAFYCQLDLQ